MSSISITAENSERETHRLDRLHNVIGYICALADFVGDDELLSKISRLHDHKGWLTVGWKSPPTQIQKNILSKAWGSEIGDGAPENIDHEFN